MQTGRRQGRRAPDGRSGIVTPAARDTGDARSNDAVRHAIRLVAPGTDMRAGLEDIIRSHEGALIVVGEPEELSFLYSGGMRLDLEFTAQHRSEERRVGKE